MRVVYYATAVSLSTECLAHDLLVVYRDGAILDRYSCPTVNAATVVVAAAAVCVAV
jgi:hypothetical protein